MLLAQFAQPGSYSLAAKVENKPVMLAQYAQPGSYCLFGIKPSFLFGSKIEASKTLRNDLKSDQRHRNDRFL